MEAFNIGFGAALALSLATSAFAQVDTSIRSFHVHISDSALTDLRRRLQATRWPDKETVSDH